MSGDGVWVKRRHLDGCGGALHRRPDVVHVDRTGRLGNGGFIAHDYQCNRNWAGCPARVLVAESVMRQIAVGALGGETPS